MRFFAAVFGIGFVVTAPAFAAEPSLGLRLMLEHCPQVDRREVERVLAAELGAHLEGSTTADVTTIVARCEGSRLVLDVTDPISRKTLRRRFDLGAAGAPGRSRLVAIAASELVLASWAELELNPSLRVEPEGGAPDATAAQAARERLRLRPPLTPLPDELAGAEPARVEILAPREGWFQASRPEHRRLRGVGLLSVRQFLNREGALYGGGLRLGQEPLVATSWAIDTIFESGKIHDRSGRRFDVDSWTLGAHVLLARRLEPVILRAGIGLRAGAVVSAPPAASSRDVVAVPWGWPLLALSVTLKGGGGFVLDVSGEGSYVALPVAQSTETATVLRGVWVSAQVGVGLMP